MEHSEWTVKFQAWQKFAQSITARARAADQMRHERGWALAASVGIPHDGCCLHNASIDTELRGWCANNPMRLKVAKQAKHLLDDWSAARVAERIISRAYPQA